jgi:carbonic anhydrase
VPKQDIQLVFLNNLLRLKPSNSSVILGTLEDTQGNLYNAIEIQLHTPSEHKLNNKQFDLEVQVIYEAIAGDFKRKAVVAFMFLKKAGVANGFWDTIDVMDLPTGDHPIPSPSLLKQDFHLYQMLFETLDKAEEHKHLPFDYFQYEGSLTTPGCEEDTTWYIVDTPFYLNGVALEFMHDSTFDPDHCSAHQYLPTFFTGTNRQL